MRESKVKDGILKVLIKGGCGWTDSAIAEHLKVSRHTVYTLLKQMEGEKHIETVERTSYGDGASAKCKVTRVLPPAVHLFETSSYQRKAFWKDVENLPKKYGIIALLVTSLGFNVKDAIEYFGHKKSHQSTTESVKLSKPADSSHRK